MAEDDDAQKTEEPSDRKIAKARQKGSVASSQEVKSWGILLGGAFMLTWLAPWVMGRVNGIASRFVTEIHLIPLDRGHLHIMMGELSLDVFIVLLPVFGLMILLALVSNLGQTGFIWATEKIKPDISKLNLIKGLKKIFSVKQLVEFAKGILKIVIVGVVSFGLALPLIKDIALVPGTHIGSTVERLQEVALWLVIGTVLVLTVVAAIDFMFQRHTYMKDLRMTKQEVKDEHKQTEGDPQIKSKIRSLRMKRAMQRMMTAVPEADVVVTNPTHYAVALTYKMENMTAPKLVAKGVDKVALRIRNVAEENDVPIVENPPLARALFATVEIDEEVPPEHYKAVAEVIGYVMRLRGELPQQGAAPH